MAGWDLGQERRLSDPGSSGHGVTFPHRLPGSFSGHLNIRVVYEPVFSQSEVSGASPF